MSADSISHPVEVDEKMPHTADEEHIYPSASEPKRWYHTGLKVFGYQFPAYNEAKVQLVMVSFVCFMCPGMFNALSGLGGGGLPKQFFATADNSSVALYCTFAAVGFFSGTIINRIGVKWAIAVGGLGYPIYTSAFLAFNFTQNTGYVVAVGAILGICAGMLWAAQGLIIMSYPTEAQKGKFVAVFWAIFNLGAVIGALVPLIQTVNSNGQSDGVGTGTYGGFLALMLVGALIALCLLPTSKIVKSDGTKVIIKSNPTWKSEFIGLFELLKIDPHIVLLFPFFFTSNWFYTYQFAEFNGAKFNIRTRSLNSLLYWASQIVGAMTWGLVLDWERWSRKVRAKYYHCALFVLTMAIWGGGYAFQKTYTREDPGELLDWTDRGYIGPMFLYMFYGIFDSIWQTYAYWLMGALSNSSRKLALYAGFYKGIQSAGAAVFWRLDAQGIAYMSGFASTWALLSGSLVISLPLVLFKIQDHSDLESDAMFTDHIHADELAARIGLEKPHDEDLAEHQ